MSNVAQTSSLPYRGGAAGRTARGGGGAPPAIRQAKTPALRSDSDNRFRQMSYGVIFHSRVSERRNSAPSATAGDASVRSPRSFFASSSKVFPAFTT